MFKSATFKLTIWYILLAMGLSLLFSGVLYHFSTDELSEALRNQYTALNDNDKDNRTYTSSDELNARSQHLLVNLTYFNVLILAGSSLASYFLARRTLRPIEVAHQAQVRFTADASHELRTPLTAMRADTEATLMRGPHDTVLLQRTLKDNLRDIDRLDRLTDHLVEISRYDSKAAPAKEDVEVESIIQEIVHQFNRRVIENGLKFEVESTPVHIQADQYSLRQLVTIILDNAIKYSQPKGKIYISCLKTGKNAVITIKDNGIGIPTDDLPHIFKRFYRSKNAGTNKMNTTGYGLGLPLAKDIVELHGGFITVHSINNEGTTVTITLPL